MHANDEIDVIAHFADTESEPIGALDGAVIGLKVTHRATTRLTHLDYPRVGLRLLDSSEPLGGDPA